MYVARELGHRGLQLIEKSRGSGNLADLAEAIAILQQSVHSTPYGHEDMPLWLNSLGISFLLRFKRMGGLSDLSEAISSQQRAVQLTPDGHPDMPSRLNNLGISFQSRFKRMGDLSDLSNAISSQQRAVQLTPNGHPDMPSRLNNLGISFQSRFVRTGDLSDISNAISSQQRAVQLTRDGHADMPSLLNNLGNSFQSRFARLGDISDLSNAISSQRRAVHLTPNGHAHMPSLLNNLGISFQSRFARLGDLADLSEAILAQQRAVQLTPNGHAHMPSLLNNLGISFKSRFVRTGDLSDISNAISSQQRAVQLTTNSHAHLPSLLNNLGSFFQSRFTRTGDLSDISEAISSQQRAVQLTPKDHADIPGLLNNLGSFFQSRFTHTKDLSDLAEAISILQRVVELIPNGHPDIPSFLKNLGNSYQSRFEHTGNSPDYYTAIRLYQESARTLGPPSARLTAAQHWAHLSKIHNDKSAATEAYAVAIDLISQIAGMDRALEQRHTDLLDISRSTTAAASAAFAQGESIKALEWLEQGCLVWSQLNQRRTAVDDLCEPQLAERFLHISSALESSGSRRRFGVLNTGAPMSQKMTLQDEAHIYIKLVGEWNQLLEEIRNIPGFHKFLRPPQASELLGHTPPDGSIILINVDQSRSDALALISGSTEPIHIPLTKFTYEKASNLNLRSRKFLSWNEVRLREENGAVRPAPDRRIESDIHFVLRVLWLEVVRPILEGLSYSVSFIFLIVPTVIRVFMRFSSVSCFVRPKANMVVPNGTSCISATTRSGNLWQHA